VGKCPVIIIGAGIGGLTTAAYLSNLKIPFLLFEQTSSIGGRCGTRKINGLNYEIGALYVGGGVFDHLRNTFGVPCNTIPVRCGVKIGENIVPFPIGLKTLWRLTNSGVSWMEMLSFLFRSRKLSDPDFINRYKSVGQVLDNLTSNKALRKFFDTIFGVSGTSSFLLPSRYLDKHNQMSRYKAEHPEYLSGGNGRIASILLDKAKIGGEVIFNTRISKIIVDKGRAIGISTDQRDYNCQVVVSNAGLRNTVLKLTAPEIWEAEYFKQVQIAKPSLKVATIFLTFSRSFKLPQGYAVFFMAEDVNREFECLEDGNLPDKSMFILHVPSNIEPDSKGDHRGTLQFYYPRGEISNKSFEKQAQLIMNKGLEKLAKGLSSAVTGYKVYDPLQYEQEFGFPPYVFGVSPDLNYKRFPNQTPITNLYCVGDSVMPEGPCVPQAMESGINCAQLIATKL